MSDKRIPMTSSLTSRDGTLTKDGLITNGYVEVQGKDKSIVFKRGGLNLVASMGTGAGQGITNYTDSLGNEQLYVVNNGTLKLTVNNPSTTWASPSVPTGSGSGLLSFGGFIWLLGGDTAGETRNVYYATSPAGPWTLGGSAQFAGNRAGMSCAVLNKIAYAVGGYTSQTSTNNNEVYMSGDGANWTLLTSSAAFPAMRYIRVLSFNGLLWAIGGDTGNGSAYGSWSNNIYSSPDGITWTLATATPGWGGSGAALRERYTAYTFGGYMYVAGGMVDPTGAKTLMNDVWRSTDGVSWTQIAASSAWSARHFHESWNLGGYILLGGGNDSSAGFNWVLTFYTSVDGYTFSSYGTFSGISIIRQYGQPQVVRGIPVDSYVFQYPSTISGGGVTLGTIVIGLNDMVDFAKNLDGTQIMGKASTVAVKLNTATNVTTQITDPGYPAVTTRGCVYLDGTFYVMEPDGTIWGSALEDCTIWSGTTDTDNFITAEFEPDQGVCLSKYNNYVVAFGQWTTQMFWDAANATGSPLSPVQNGVILVGCAHANSVCQVESTVLWMAQRKGQGSSFQKGRFIAMLEGNSYVQISTPDVDRVLDADDLATVYSCVGSFGGHNFYILSLGTTGVSVVYDMTQKLWYVWTRCTAGTGITLTSLTQSNGLATATKSGHGLSDGDPVTIAGANQSGYNLTNVNVTVTSSSTFTFPVASATVSPATGTITATPVSESYFNMVASCNYGGQQVFQESSGGNIFSLLDTVFQDNTYPINWKVRTSKQDNGNNNNKFCFAVTPIGDIYSGTGLIRYTDDDYSTYSYYRRFTMSDVKPQNQRYGKYRRRGWEWRYTGNTRGRIEALEIDMEQGYS